LTAERDKKMEIMADEGEEAATKYENEAITPLASQTFRLSLNIRYYALAGLSLRRYVGGRLYVLLKPLYITGGGNATYQRFTDRFEHLLEQFEQTIVPYLGELDI
jgi:hypothetical protein